MSWWVAGVAVAGAASKFLGSQSQSRDMKEAARDSLLTGRYNINQRKLESRQTQFAMLEQGHQAASNIQRSADQAVGTATAAAGGSGAIVESGTPRAVLTNIAQEGLHAQMGAILNTKNAIKANVRQTEAMNKTEWNQANAYSKGMERDAKRTMDSARMNLAADTISAVAGGYASSLSAASTTGKVIKGAQVAKSVSNMGNVPRGHTGPRAKIPTQGRPSRDDGDWDGDFEPVHRSVQRSYGPGTNAPIGGGRMKAGRWRWNKYTTQGLMTQKGQSYSWKRKAGRY
jgi:hypothetical protein